MTTTGRAVTQGTKRRGARERLALGATVTMLLAACSRSKDPPAPSPVDASSQPTEEPGPCARESDASLPAALFEPPNVPNVSLDGANGALTLYASTLRNGPGGLELYAGVCNRSDFPMCSAALQVEFYDEAEQLIATANGAVQSGRIFGMSQSPYPVACVAPGQKAMVALTSLPEELALSDLKSMGHRFPAFRIDDATPLSGPSVTHVEVSETAAGVVFRGTVTNDADSPLTNPAISVFPVNEIGRPLAVATSTAAVEIPPGGTWAFETTPVTESGAEQLAFATATFATSE